MKKLIIIVILVLVIVSMLKKDEVPSQPDQDPKDDHLRVVKPKVGILSQTGGDVKTVVKDLVVGTVNKIGEVVNPIAAPKPETKIVNGQIVPGNSTPKIILNKSGVNLGAEPVEIDPTGLPDIFITDRVINPNPKFSIHA